MPHSPTLVVAETSPSAHKRRLFVLITMRLGGRVETSSHNLTLAAGTPYEDVLEYVTTSCVPEHVRGGAVLHCSIHPAVVA